MISGRDIDPSSPERESRKSILARYGSSLAVVALAVLLRYWFGRYLHQSDFAVPLVAVLISAWIGGLGPSLVGITLLVVAEVTWFRPPSRSPFEFDLRTAVTFGAVYLFGISVALLSQSRRAANLRAQAQRDEAVSQRERLRATLTCMGDGVLVTDAEGQLSMMNPAAELMTGWAMIDALGKPVIDVFAICDEQTHEKAESPVLRVMRKGQVLQETARLLQTTRDDKWIPVSYSAAPIADARGRTTGVVLVFRDETERRRTEQALRNADRRKDEFLATLAHELRNPLAPICAGLELMKLCPDDHKRVAGIRVMMERQAQHMVRLIDDLLDVSRITRGRLELRRRPVELGEVVRDAADATRPLIDEAGHQLTINLPTQPVLVYADPNRLTQILSNLLNNAAKYTPRGGRIALDAEQFEGEVAVTITDNGAGVPANMQDEIFELFTQINKSTKSGHQGLGIGLTLVKQLVEMHGGTVGVRSEGAGTGSAFWVRLPALHRSSAAEVVPTPSLPDIEPMVRRKILVVDDNEDALETLCLLVRALGNDVCTARDGLEAIEAAERFLPEIILMDLGMPNLDGYQAARRIRAERWGMETMIIATTGWGHEEDRRRTEEAGFDHHLVKPIEVTALRALLEGAKPASPMAPSRTDAATSDNGLSTHLKKTRSFA